MKYFAMFLLLAAGMAWAEPKTEQLGRLRGLCNKLPGLQKVTAAKKKEFCDCFTREMRKLNETEATLMIQFLSGEKDVKSIEAVNRMIPEFEYNVEEYCHK